jgi:zinc metalloprotease ZmpB
MPRTVFPADVQVRHDEHDRLRQLCQPFAAPASGSASAGTVKPALQVPDDAALQALAQAFLDQSATDFGITALRQSGRDFATNLRLGQVKRAVGNAVAVSFEQYIDDWPVWRAGVTVRMDARRMRVTGAHNAAHLDLRLHRCGDQAAYVPSRIDAARMKDLLQIGPETDLIINGAPRMLVYQFKEANRLASTTESASPYPADRAAPGCLPGLPLPPLAPQVLALEDMHCVVTEVLFSVAIRGWGGVNCRAFLEPDTGAVLYLRALVSCAAPDVTGLVFPRDPASLGPPGAAIPNPASPVAQLDGFRARVRLRGLQPPNANGECNLTGEFIRLAHLEQPAPPMPSQGSPFRFDYSCDTPEFAAASAYHHCDGAFRTVEALGIDVRTYFSHTNFPVDVDPHAFHRGVNAQAVGSASGRGLAQLMFGSACDGSDFGIAADPRVVLHEFGHAVLWEHIGSSSFPFAHSVGDSLAAILHAPFSAAEDRGNTFPFLNHLAEFDRRHDRRVDQGWGWYGNHYDRQYGGEQVLSSTLYRLYRAAGGDSQEQAERVAASRYVVYLLLAGIAMLDFTPDRVEVLVDAIMEADAVTDVFDGFAGGAMGKAIRWAFEQQGLYRPENQLGIGLVPGDPPPLDLYIDDGRKGSYDYPHPLQDLLSPPGLWNRLVADRGRGHQAPILGAPNFAYVEVSNRGTGPASGVEVRAYQAADGAQRRWGQDWTELPGGPLRVQADIASPGSEIAGPIAWTPQTAHDHLLVFAAAPGDRSSLLAADPVGHVVDRFVRLDNNIVERRF